MSGSFQSVQLRHRSITQTDTSENKGPGSCSQTGIGLSVDWSWIWSQWPSWQEIPHASCPGPGLRPLGGQTSSCEQSMERGMRSPAFHSEKCPPPPPHDGYLGECSLSKGRGYRRDRGQCFMMIASETQWGKLRLISFKFTCHSPGSMSSLQDKFSVQNECWLIYFYNFELSLKSTPKPCFLLSEKPLTGHLWAIEDVRGRCILPTAPKF